MQVLLLGAGLQGKAALYDLARSPVVTGITAADVDLAGLEAHLRGQDYRDRVRCAPVDARDSASVERLMAAHPDVVIDLLPPDFAGAVVAAAVAHGVHVVNTFYVRPPVAALAPEAERRGVTILPECGLDPGIDLVLMAAAVRDLDRVESLLSYGAGVPEAAAADNPLKYKISWTFAGVLRSYHRAGRVIRGGEVVAIGASEQFVPRHTHLLEIEGLGCFEAYPNGDALPYVEWLGLDRRHLRELGRFTLRWPGHCAFWRTVVELGLLDDEPVTIDGTAVDRRQFLAAALEPRLRYAPHERDLAILRVEALGVKNGARQRVIYQLIDRRDLTSGLSAMNRTVGFTASIGAQLIGTGAISRRGLLSPVADLPYELLVGELERRGIRITRAVTSGGAITPPPAV
jgi:lysine 6-dehydrogenase